LLDLYLTNHGFRKHVLGCWRTFSPSTGKHT
jgi:hypothetical protein